jgi:AcrR family transcriptional regulator
MPTATWFRLNVAKRERVLNVAMREFGEHGYSHGSLNTIARDAEIAKGSLFQYFTDKQEFFGYVCDEASRRTREEMERRVVGLDFDQPFDDWLVDVFLEWTEFIADHPLERGVTAAAVFELDGDVRGVVRETANQHYLQIIDSMLTLWNERGELRPDADLQVLSSLAILLFQHIALAPYYEGLDPVFHLFGRTVDEQRPIVRQFVAGMRPLFSDK